MAIRFSCPSCNKSFTVKDHLAGKRAPCPACGKPVLIPQPDKPGSVPVAQPATGSAPVDAEALAAEALAALEDPEPKELAEIEFVCAFCDSKVKVAGELAGKRAPCPECRRIVPVPLPKALAKKDWRSVENRPSGARVDNLPGMENAWDARTAARVSRQALVEAKAIKEAKIKLTWGQISKRAIYSTAAVGAIIGAVWYVMDYNARNRESRSFAQAMELAAKSANLTSDNQAALQRLAGQYLLHGNVPEEAQKRLAEARSRLLQPTPAGPGEQESSLIELARTQVELGGDKDQLERQTRLKWDAVIAEINTTLQTIQHPLARAEALRGVARALISAGQAALVPALATSYPDQEPQSRGILGLELLKANDKATAEQLANQGIQTYASAAARAKDPKQVAGFPSEIVVLLYALNMKGRADTLVGSLDPANKPGQLAALLGQVEGIARAGNLSAAREMAKTVVEPGERLQALLAFAAGAAEADPSAAKVELEEAIRLAGEMKDPPVPAWQAFQLVSLSLKAGLGESIAPVVAAIGEPGMRGRAQALAWFASGARAGGLVPEGIDKETTACGLAVYEKAKEASKAGEPSSAIADAGKLEPEKLRSFALIGVARGLQERRGQ